MSTVHPASRYTSLLLLLGLLIISSTALSENISFEEILTLSLTDLVNLEIYSANKTHETIKESPASIYIVNRADIERYGYNTLTDILENVPGFYNIYSYNGAPGNFGVRGFWNPNQQNSSMAILVNGVHQYTFDSRSSPMEQIPVPVEAIDKIEITRGPNAVIYGSGASFGVVNIITNTVTDDQKKSLFAYSSGSLNTERAALRVALKENDLKLVMNAGTYSTNGPDNKFYDLMNSDNFSTLPSFGITDPEYSTNELLEQHNKYFNINSSYKNWFFDFAFNQSSTEFFILVPSVQDGSERKSTSINMTVGYAYEINDWIDMNFKSTYYQHNRDTDFDAFSPSFYGIINSSYDAYNIELLSNIKASDDTSILIGLNYQSMKNLDELTDIPALNFNQDSYFIDDRPLHAVFSQINYQATDKLKLTAGGRFEEIQPYRSTFISDTGEASENRIISNNESIHINSYRGAAVYSSTDEHTFKFMIGNSSRISGDDFLPEETDTIELNYLYVVENLYTSVSLFHNNLRNLVVPFLVDDGAGGLSTEEDTSGKLSTDGIEIIINKNFQKYWLIEAGITYQDTSDDINKNLEPAYSPDLLSHIKLSYKSRKSTYSLISRYVDEMESFYDPGIDNGDGSFGNRTGDKINSYATLDANIRIDNIYEGFYLNVKANNLLDKTIRYPNNNDNNTLLDKGTLGNERIITVTVGIDF
ncbi:MAG: hypothetical protein DIZ80_16860 [endosymbiont of Galathealinum brachiosum]|uniref:TonB-dependent receptor plug domain-containing protein n=1 Tax=endosymbiont of Galathealinum brachiosum TaxID=2200906 RepID=A0A370D8T4_9GAMM|nr:MAG: hypothetical protein DIZ80_16860 [endosymbiont of Galathealinum brachiosum]